MKRDYYQDIGYKPFLFYLIFGMSIKNWKCLRRGIRFMSCLKGSIYDHLQEKRKEQWAKRFLTRK